MHKELKNNKNDASRDTDNKNYVMLSAVKQHQLALEREDSQIQQNKRVDEHHKKHFINGF
jgi:hypothetical protein